MEQKSSDTKINMENVQRNNTGLKDKLLELSFYTACAGTISIAESLIPKPFPFLRIGLSNIILMLLVMNRQEFSALFVLLGRIILAGLVVGTLLMPTSLIALGSGFVSLLVMIAVSRMKTKLSWVGISILAAVVHNLTQLVIVRAILIYSDALFNLIPIMIILGIATGTVTGILAVALNQRLPRRVNENKIFG